MNSRFYYPINTGSIGEPRRANSFMSSVMQRASPRFEADYVPRPSRFPKPTVIENRLFVELPRHEYEHRLPK
jgi:hypothetical protein